MKKNETWSEAESQALQYLEKSRWLGGACVLLIGVGEIIAAQGVTEDVLSSLLTFFIGVLTFLSALVLRHIRKTNVKEEGIVEPSSKWEKVVISLPAAMAFLFGVSGGYLTLIIGASAWLIGIGSIHMANKARSLLKL